jgi:hypothetical protein
MVENGERDRSPLGAVSGSPSNRPPAGAPSPLSRPPRPAPANRNSDATASTDEGKKKKKKKKDRKKKGGTARGVETMFRTSYRTHIDMSGLADNKANIMISINGIIMSVIIASISPKIDANQWLLVPTAVLLIGCLISMIFAILAARPRVSSQQVTLADVRHKRANILFFGNFVNLPKQDYVQGMTELIDNPDSLYNSMIQDIYSLGGVLYHKFRYLRISYAVFMASLIVGVVLFIIVLTSVALSTSAGATIGPGPLGGS